MDLVTTSRYDERDDKMIVTTTYDNSAVLEANKADRNASPETGRYKGNHSLIQVGRVHMGDVERLRVMGYNLLSGDPEETKRALLYIQSNEPHLLTVPGTPISRKKMKWV